MGSLLGTFKYYELLLILADLFTLVAMRDSAL
jgi:hypothetical protein